MPMTYSEVLDAIAKLENAADVKDGLTAHVSGLNAEAASWRSKFREAESQLTRLKELTGDSSKDTEQTIKDLKAQVETLTKEKDDAIKAKDEAVKAKEEAERTKQGLELSGHLRKAAEKAGGNSAAFENAFKDLSVERIKITDTGVMIVSEDGKGEEAIADWVNKNMAWMTPALFPNGTTPAPTPSPSPSPTPTPAPARLPDGGSGGTPQTPDAAKDYVSANFSGIRRFQKKT